MRTKKLTILAMLTAVSLVIFIIESQLPPLAPIPGIKLGLANIVTLITLARIGRREAFLVLILRIILGCVFTGQMMSLMYSLAGGFLCFAVMAVLIKAAPKQQRQSRKDGEAAYVIPIWVVSIFGAIAHNAGQVIVAIAITHLTQIIAFIPLLIISAVITGAFTGGIATVIANKKSLWRVLDED
ncbi:MAG: Gx transporter family protein [Clostridia bacterium]|nr:Gx transporter family protein [Clostridia bacterium]